MGIMDSQWAAFCQFGCYCKPIPCDESTAYSGDTKKIRDEIDTHIKILRVVKEGATLALQAGYYTSYRAVDTICIDLSDAPLGTTEWLTEKLKGDKIKKQEGKDE